VPSLLFLSGKDYNLINYEHSEGPLQELYSSITSIDGCRCQHEKFHHAAEGSCLSVKGLDVELEGCCDGSHSSIEGCEACELQHGQQVWSC